jgi:transketolase
MIWEAAMSAAHYKLDNYTVLLDHNGLQIDGSNESVMGLGDIMAKYKAFGFECLKVDGHDVDAIVAAIQAPCIGKPKFICCETVKGKGVSFMENNAGWHGRPMQKEEYALAMKEVGGEDNV